MTLPAWITLLVLSGLWLIEAGLIWAIRGGRYWSYEQTRYRSTRAAGLVSLFIGAGCLWVARLMASDAAWDVLVLAGACAAAAWSSVASFRATSFSEGELLSALEDLPSLQERARKPAPAGASSLHRIVTKLWALAPNDLEWQRTRPRRWERSKAWLRMGLQLGVVVGLVVSAFGPTPWSQSEWVLAAACVALTPIHLLLFRKLLRQLHAVAPRLEQALLADAGLESEPAGR